MVVVACQLHVEVNVTASDLGREILDQPATQRIGEGTVKDILVIYL